MKPLLVVVGAWFLGIGTVLVLHPEQARSVDGPTLGGTQFWTDRLIHGDWRIQQNAVTGHFRLLDDHNVRQASGTYSQCRAEFLRLKAERELPALKSTAVVTLHGLGGWRGLMQPLADYIAEQGNWTPINFTYASTRKTVEDHAQSLALVIDNLTDVEQVHFVAHSLGNVVVRRYLDLHAKDPAAERRGAKIGRVVMIGPPNNGSSVARLLESNKLFEWIGGSSAQQLGTAWDELKPRLATPQDFGIIAGSTFGGAGGNPLVEGDDDLFVGVEETKLPGAADFLTVPSTHTLLLAKREVREATLRFLEHGYFISADARKPLGNDAVAAE
ncbi:MAG: alpha/beta fold hydrolase [Pirellulales bacterium]|nr:alpha/beta fold hydrolase [Pirellulales bacterium]